MSHTYTLVADGLPARQIAGRHIRTAQVQNPRVVEVEGVKLLLNDTEPDLPVGKKLKIWKDRQFCCAKIDPIENLSERYEADKRKAGDIFPQEYLFDTQLFLQQKPGAKELRAHLEYLRSERLKHEARSKKLERAKTLEDKTKREDAILCAVATDEASTFVSKYIIKRLAERGVIGGAAYAYGPREGVHYDVHTPGRDHFQLARPIVSGRLVRQMGDVMCKSSRQFWGLRVTDDRYRISCWACLKRMLNLLE